MINETAGRATQDGWEARGNRVRAAAVRAPTFSLSVAMVTVAAGTHWEPSRHTGGQTFISNPELSPAFLNQHNELFSQGVSAYKPRGQFILA